MGSLRFYFPRLRRTLPLQGAVMCEFLSQTSKDVFGCVCSFMREPPDSEFDQQQKYCDHEVD